jgi:hypothetical protein
VGWLESFRRPGAWGAPSDDGSILGRMAKAAAAELLPTGPEDVPVARLSAATPLPPLELPAPKRPTWPTLAALAIASGMAAVGLGAWAVFAQSREEPPTTTAPTLEWSLAVLADSAAERYPLEHSVGRIALVVGPDGRAVITLDGLGVAPEGFVYRAWLVPPGSATPSPVATFDASTRVVPLLQRVARGARVGVTLEPRSGAPRPSRALRLVASRP